MARKSMLTTVIETAKSNVSKLIVAQSIASTPPGTLVGAFLGELKQHSLDGMFLNMTIGDLAEAFSGHAMPLETSSRAAAAAPVSLQAETKVVRKPGRGGKKFNTRTAEGRAEIDAAVAGFLQMHNDVRAEEIRAAIGGTPAQLRESLSRYMDEGKIVKEGEKRSTIYTWLGDEGKRRGRR